jgi:hypothetical protein
MPLYSIPSGRIEGLPTDIRLGRDHSRWPDAAALLGHALRFNRNLILVRHGWQLLLNK